MTNTKELQYWVYYDVKFHSLSHYVWDKLDPRVPDYYEKRLNPHITVHPGFQFPVSDQEFFRYVFYDTFPQQITVDITDFYFYPDESKPLVICLDVETDIDFEEKQQKAVDMIQDSETGKNLESPTQPHISLYISRDTSKDDYRLIPPNTMHIRNQCEKIANEKLPITVSETELKIERNN